MTEYPIKVQNRAREIWLDFPAGATPPSFDFVAKKVNAELSVNVTRKTVHQWCKQYSWEDSVNIVGAVHPPAAPATAPGGGGSAPSPSVEPSDEQLIEFDWEEKKLKFLAKLAGVAEACLALGLNEDGTPQLLFKDTESRVKTGAVVLELMGKINSGKFDQQERGDMLPAISAEKLKQVFNFYFDKNAPEPKIEPIEAEWEPLKPLALSEAE